MPVAGKYAGSVIQRELGTVQKRPKNVAEGLFRIFGAGDVFHGAFCYGLVQGFTTEENLRFASATSALKCRRIGGRAGIPNREEVDLFLRERSAL